MHFWRQYVAMNKKKIYLLKKILKLNEWQTSLLEERPYAQEIVRGLTYLLRDSDEIRIIEVGVGIGEIIANVSKSKKKIERIGFDINKSNIIAGRIMNPNVKFKVGTFSDVNCGHIDALIMVNFIHSISPDLLRAQITSLLSKNNVKMFVIDTFVNHTNTEYTFSHSGNELFGEKYILKKRSRGFVAAHGARRYIEYWEKK